MACGRLFIPMLNFINAILVMNSMNILCGLHTIYKSEGREFIATGISGSIAKREESMASQAALISTFSMAIQPNSLIYLSGRSIKSLFYEQYGRRCSSVPKKNCENTFCSAGVVVG